MNEQNKTAFTAYLQAKNNLQSTIEKYIAQIEKIEHWLELHRAKPIDQAEKKDILAYLLHIQKLSGSTRQHKLGILSHYYTFLYSTEQCAQNPTRGIKLRGTRKTILPSILTVEQMEELLDTHFVLNVQHAGTQKNNEKGQFLTSKHVHLRNHLILSFCVYQGLTRAEWQALKLEDVNLQKATLHIQAGRQTNARTLPLHATQIGIIYAYLNESRPHFNLTENQLLNPKFQTHRFMGELRKIYPNFKELTQLRASIITHWIKTEGLRKAQYKAGHRYISSTEKYQANDLDSLKDDITRFHPI